MTRTITGGPAGSGPLTWEFGLVRQDGGSVAEQVAKLVGEGFAVHEELERLCFDALLRLLARHDVDADEETITILAAQFLDAASAARSLLSEGRVRASMSQLRTMVESNALMLYLKGRPERAHAWHDAESRSDRVKFSFESIRQDVDKDGSLKSIWDFCNEVVHTNSAAMPALMRPRPVNGFDIHVGPFFDPGNIAGFLLLSTILLIQLASALREWYEEIPDFPEEFASILDNIVAGHKQYSDDVEKRAKKLDAELQSQPGTMSILEQIAAQAYLDARYESWVNQVRDVSGRTGTSHS